MLFGDVGSGKTTLARIYARALNCQTPDPATGSPCLACSNCQDLSSRFAEYDTPLKTGDILPVKQFVEANDHRGTGGRPCVIFFDEAHRLTDKASNYLLKRMEEIHANDSAAAYVFATTAPERLRPALKSRLKPIHIAKLSLKVADDLLTSVATAESLSVEEGCFDLIIRYAGLQPRDLVGAMETVTDRRAKQLRLDTVKQRFGYDHIDVIEDYFVSLGAGNLPQITELLGEWPVSTLEKIEWIEAYLASFYMRTLQVIDISVDPIVDKLVAKREDVLRSFLGRYKLANRVELAPIWRQMMQFWAEPVRSEPAAATRIALFHDRAHRGDWLMPSLALPTPSIPLTSTPEALRRFDEPGYLENRHVRDIINGASYLVQRSGRFLNVLLRFETSSSGVVSPSDAVEAVDQAASDLFSVIGRALDATADEHSAIRLAENTSDGVVAYLTLSVPSLAHEEDEVMGPRRAVEAWVARRAGVEVIYSQPQDHRNAGQMHWKIVKDLLAGYMDDARPTATSIPLSQLLKLKQRRHPGRLRLEPVRFWGAASPSVNATGNDAGACLKSMFDEQRYEEIFLGWERVAFARRRLAALEGN